jgi:hypothetical protein
VGSNRPAVTKLGYMLEHPRIRRYSFVSYNLFRVNDMSSNNPIGADNQQETAMRDPQRLYAERRSGDETVRAPWRHGEDGRNDRPATLF